MGPLSFGIPGTSRASAWDLDFLSIANGIHVPTAGGPPGDFDGDGDLDVADIDLLAMESAAGTNNPSFDINGDGSVNGLDVTAWAKDLHNSWIGDANADGEFNSGDFVQVFGAGKFETDQDAKWSEGDWNGDGKFNSGDFVAAFSDGGFELGPRAVATVPEPSSIVVAITPSRQ